MLNIISHILFYKYTNVLRWTIISWQALAEYLQIVTVTKDKTQFFNVTHVRKIKIYFNTF